MAYVIATNVPNKITTGTIDGVASGPSVWSYTHLTDSDATVKAAGYITDGVLRGMAIGDVVYYYAASVPAVYIHFVLSVTGNAVNLSQTPAALT